MSRITCCAAWCKRVYLAENPMVTVPTDEQERRRILKQLGRTDVDIDKYIAQTTHLRFCRVHLHDGERLTQRSPIVLLPREADPVWTGALPGWNTTQKVLFPSDPQVPTLPTTPLLQSPLPPPPPPPPPPPSHREPRVVAQVLRDRCACT